MTVKTLKPNLLIGDRCHPEVGTVVDVDDRTVRRYINAGAVVPYLPAGKPRRDHEEASVAVPPNRAAKRT